MHPGIIRAENGKRQPPARSRSAPTDLCIAEILDDLAGLEANQQILGTGGLENDVHDHAQGARLMRSRTLMLSVLCSVLGSLALAQSAPKIVETVAGYTPPSSGPEMFREYCSACHGANGAGTGPAAAALKKQPTNLTELKAKNGGKFPATRIISFIRGNNQVSAHGTREMPIWGNIFGKMDGNDAVATLRLSNLTTYIESLQK